MKGHGVAALGCPLPLSGLSGDGDLVITEARLVANRAAPVRRWQAKQWHMALREGSPEVSRFGK
jgi:hypothetical protein